jgi:hypothetical protein
MFNPHPLKGLGFRAVFPATGANPALRHTVSIFEVTGLFERARAAMTTFQLAFPGRVKYRQVCIVPMCDLRGLPRTCCALSVLSAPAGQFNLGLGRGVSG